MDIEKPTLVTTHMVSIGDMVKKVSSSFGNDPCFCFLHGVYNKEKILKTIEQLFY